MNNLVSFIMHIDARMQVQTPRHHVPCNTVPRLQQRRLCDSLLRHEPAFRVQDLVDTIMKMKEKSWHEALLWAGAHFDGSGTALRVSGLLA
ncbi:hypothetical protein G7A66_05480 [Altererythrobacter sp. SALINAS58]|uniref:hypothetical protein n=1 Tax=Alteripontixanthobacter muriae TaxID=2705546 RepID=UPI001575A5B0|nr:hypothetical protein [Alteripontixanthobacter muriae]NTZ42545.1 hypothetical protein [Alteripontixanthobacter muriae]